MPSLIYLLFQPMLDALSPFSRIPINLRLRLLAFQPLSILIYGLTGLPFQLSNKRHEVIQVPLPQARGGGSIRCFAFAPPSTKPYKGLRPLHIAIHGGAFIGGFAESTAAFCKSLSQQTGCVAVGISYRFAPRHTFPTAHEDVRDVVRWLCANSERLWGADGSRVTVSGFSAGGNLAMNIATKSDDRDDLPTVDAWVGCYTPVDLSIPPWSKPRPPGFPNRDPLSFLVPLYDAYGSSTRRIEPRSKRANPCLRCEISDLETIPKRMLFIIAAVDILLKEQLEYVQTLKENINDGEATSGGSTFRVESQVFENAFHGWLELPDYLLPKAEYKVSKHQALELSIGFLEQSINQLREVDVD